MNRKNSLVMAILFVLALVSCSEKQSAKSELKQSGNENSQETPAENIKNIRIGYQKAGALVYIKNKHFIDDELAKQNITVNWTEFPSGPPMLEALNTGNLDFATTGEAPPIFAQAAKAGLIYVGRDAASPEAEGLLVPKNSTITNPVALKGKKIAFTKGSSSNNFVVLFLKKYGLNYADIQAIYLQPADARAAFEQGSVDAWVVWEPYLSAAEIQLGAKQLINATGLKPNYMFYFGSKEFVEKQAELIKTILKQIDLGDDEIKKNIADFAHVRSELTGLPIDVALESVKRQNYGVSSISAEVIAEQQEIADSFFELGLIPKKITVSETVWNQNQ